MGWLTTALILIPLGGAVFVWLLPWDSFTAGAIALLVALAEVGVWIESLIRFHFDRGGLQLDQRTNWFSDLHVSYHVGVYGFSLWLVGLAVVVQAAAIAYAFWAGRTGARAYFGLMLLLTAAIVGVFTAQDLLLFYVFWEAMLLPLYILIGVWGGAGRLGATIKFVIYTMAGSLLMLAAVIVLGLSQGTFDLTASWQSSSDWLFLGFVAAFAVKAPLFPLHGWLSDAYRESPPEVSAVLSGVVSKAAIYGFIRIAITKFPKPTQDFRTAILVLAAVGEVAILAGVFTRGWGYSVVGGVAIVLAAMYMLRLISAVLHERVGLAVAPEALDIRPGELSAIVPLLACLLALSVWPAAITERSFAGDRAATAVTNQFRVAAGRPRLDYILVGRSVGSEQQHSCLKKYRQALKAGRYGKASSLAETC